MIYPNLENGIKIIEILEKKCDKKIKQKIKNIGIYLKNHYEHQKKTFFYSVSTVDYYSPIYKKKLKLRKNLNYINLENSTKLIHSLILKNTNKIIKEKLCTLSNYLTKHEELIKTRLKMYMYYFNK
jgi:hypothetical protein